MHVHPTSRRIRTVANASTHALWRSVGRNSPEGKGELSPALKSGIQRIMCHNAFFIVIILCSSLWFVSSLISSTSLSCRLRLMQPLLSNGRLVGGREKRASFALAASLKSETKGKIAKDGQKIEKLLMAALKLAEGMSNSTTWKSEVKNMGLIDMNFKASHKEKFSLNNPYIAREYLSLPASQYSILSSNIITRINPDNGVGDATLCDEGDLFRVIVPIPTRMTEQDTGVTTDVIINALADVRVDPRPERGEVVMESGPIYLQTSQSLPANITNRNSERCYDYKQNITETDQLRGNDEAALRSILPSWLLQLDQEEGEDELAGAALKSSIQAGFIIKLLWKPNTLSPSKLSTLEMVGGGEAGDAVSPSEQNSEEALPVTGKVDVRVDLRLPIRKDISRAVNFPPVKLMLSQAGTLIVKAIIRGVAPTLTSLLDKDYAKFRDGDKVRER